MALWLWHSLIARQSGSIKKARGLFSGAAAILGSRILPRMTASSCLRDIQVGVGYVRAHPDYSPSSFSGYTIFADADLLQHLGIEADIHRISGNVPNTLSETSYEVGGRYRYPIGPFSPYVKLLFGAGTFSFGSSTQNGTYGMYSGGGGVDFLALKHIVVRADFEYQRWGGFPPRGLQPNLFTVGAAYRFR